MFGYRPFLERRIAAQEAALEQLSSIIPQEQQEEFITFYSQLVNAQGLLRNHRTASRLFTLLETTTNTEVGYSGMDERVPERSVILEGNALQYRAFADQLHAFSIAPAVESVIVHDSSAAGGRVRFRLSLKVNESVFAAQRPDSTGALSRQGGGFVQ